MSDIKKPSIHMNGSGKQHLMDQYRAALYALNSALNALNDAYPHGRDYYVQGDDVIYTACREQDARIAAVKKVRDDMESIVTHINSFNR